MPPASTPRRQPTAAIGLPRLLATAVLCFVNAAAWAQLQRCDRDGRRRLLELEIKAGAFIGVQRMFEGDAERCGLSGRFAQGLFALGVRRLSGGWQDSTPTPS